jgi:hypothetical protein
MSDRALFYAMVLVFLVGSIALFLGASAESTVATVFGLVSWIAALAILVFWLVRKRNKTIQ